MRKILIIDDSLYQRRSIRKILSQKPYEIQEATNGREGLEMLKSYQPDCVILDILMPDMDGLAFLATTQKQGETTPIIVLTADIQETTRRECQRLGASAIEYKPLSPLDSEKFLEMVERIIQSKGGAST
ncbi:response regulator receiver protein [Candidatus Moduliflexus flocculans]|uniref:Response regulator receiver protein n=1 Tax=Candidatus Moduliflexus flocculans TaxID=1499966 RepID=A0A081BM86_9BACT|nr:response regulator receiver protein [Candidatus Moduliflexus flocculans]